MAIRKASSGRKQVDDDEVIIRKAGSTSRSRSKNGGVVIPGWLWASVALILIGWMFVRFVMPSISDSKEATARKTKVKKEKLKDRKADKSKNDASETPAVSLKDRLLGMFGLSDTTKKKSDSKKRKPKASPVADELSFTALKHFYWPDTSGDLQIIKHNTFTLSYNEDAEQANWVAYILTTADVNGTAVRDNESFNPDPLVRTGSASPLDYRGSGFDRGHLLPSADRKATEKQQAETFYMSNISPQVHRMNAGIWESAERRVRGWALNYGKVWVVTGPCLKPMPKQRIGDNQVAVPEKFYKVVLTLNPDKTFRMIGFIIPNEATKKPLASFVLPVDDIEDLTGIDFFPALPDDIEDTVEADSDISLWP